MEGWVSAFGRGHKTVISTKDWHSPVADYSSPLACGRRGIMARCLYKLLVAGIDGCRGGWVSFKVDLATAFRLSERFRKNVVRVAESGIQSGNDIARLRAAGYQAFLIGELLMKAPSPGAALRTLIREASRGQRVLTARG